MVAALLGIWKAGGAYVPLDPAASVDQIAFMLEDAAPPFVLTRKKFFARVPGPRLPNLHLTCVYWTSTTFAPGEVLRLRHNHSYRR